VLRCVVSLLLVGAVVAACTATPTAGTRLRRGNPATETGDDDDDVVVDASTRGVDIAKPVTPAEPVDSGPAPSRACNAGELAFCFTFEGTSDDVSPIGLKPETVTNVTFAPGRENQAASFSATSALRFAPNAAFELPANATIEAWIKRMNTGTDSVVVDIDGRFSLTIDAAGNLLCKSSGGAATAIKLVPVEQWAHVACVVDAGTLRAYLDGVEIASGPGAIGSAPTLGAAVGGNSPDGEPYLGLIDSLRVFRVARTPAQITEAAKP